MLASTIFFFSYPVLCGKFVYCGRFRPSDDCLFYVFSAVRMYSVKDFSIQNVHLLDVGTGRSGLLLSRFRSES